MTTRLDVRSRNEVRAALERAFPGAQNFDAVRAAAGHLSDRKLRSHYSSTLDCHIVLADDRR